MYTKSATNMQHAWNYFTQTQKNPPILGYSRWTRSPMLGVNPVVRLKLFGREIIFEKFQPMWSRYVNVTDGQTDRQTTYCHITPLCVASRSKNENVYNELISHVSENMTIWKKKSLNQKVCRRVIKVHIRPINCTFYRTQKESQRNLS